MSEKPSCYQREAFLLTATRRVAIKRYVAFLLISCCLLAYRSKVTRLSLAPLALTSRGARAYFS